MKNKVTTENSNLGKTINEVRKEQGLEPIEGGEARLPSNAIVMFCKGKDFHEGKDGIFHIGADMKEPVGYDSDLEDGDTVRVVNEEEGLDILGTAHLQADGSFAIKPKEAEEE
ncbi:hypothetical protein Goe16_01910 [Bacillus phage vB_BsuM-Goe16]|nr:hypothetical protein Goe16_01910 [Bacillus phage vB_BsuM-Goe16]